MTQHLFLLSVLIATSTIGIVVAKLGADKATSISLHATKHLAAFFSVALGITLSLVLNTLYLFGWLLPEKRLNVIGVSLYLAIIGFFLVAAWTPDIPGKLRRVHRFTAYGAVFAMPLLLLTVLISIPLQVTLQVTIGTVIISHVMMIYLSFFVPSANRYFLIYQALYLAGFWLSIIGVTYLN